MWGWGRVGVLGGGPENVGGDWNNGSQEDRNHSEVLPNLRWGAVVGLVVFPGAHAKKHSRVVVVPL